IALTAVSWGSAYAFSQGQFKYEYNVNGLLVQSNYSDPVTYFAELGNQENFIVSPQMHESVPAAESHVFDASNTFSVVLNGNDKNVTLLIRVLDSSNNRIYCLTNYGNVQVSEQISNETCTEMLESQDTVKILIELPNEFLSMPTAMLEENRITVQTQNYGQLDNVSFIVARIMYANAQEIIDKSNSFIQRVL
ncbi:MAG: hypothetical protein JW772_02785, partial [Candidatus Diapherotrites archaeon]|nr:hypothetical protein [Candidatus Diapherotrites archaeon]